MNAVRKACLILIACTELADVEAPASTLISKNDPMFEEYGHWKISNWNQTMYSKNNDNVIRAMIIMWQHDERYKYV